MSKSPYVSERLSEFEVLEFSVYYLPSLLEVLSVCQDKAIACL